MGFYGNITNVSKSTFQFDKIYSNRFTMDNSADIDNVFVGRYVLVDYNEGASIDTIAEVVSQDDDDSNSMDILDYKFVPGYRLMIWDSESGEYVPSTPLKFYSGLPTYDARTGKLDINSVKMYDKNTIEADGKSFLVCIGEISEKTSNIGTEELPDLKTEYNINLNVSHVVYSVGIDEEDNLMFTLLSDIESREELINLFDGYYAVNHNIDARYYKKKYGIKIGRGWDSTVWQKTYKDGKYQYVMVAELNSVVPSFDISVDAPTEEIVKPYWEADTSNVYYKLHIQPHLGFKLRDADGKKSWLLRSEAFDIKDNESDTFKKEEIGYGNGHQYPSDDENNKAIYWFNKGFDKYSVYEVEKEKAKDGTEKEIKDKLLLKLTGDSGNFYFDNDENSSTYLQTKQHIKPDTYELSILLPTIGQTIASLWNIIYGEGKEFDSTANILWNKKTNVFANEDKNGILVRNTNLEWNTYNGDRAYVDLEYEEKYFNQLGENDHIPTDDVKYYFKKIQITEGQFSYKQISQEDMEKELRESAGTYYYKKPNRQYNKQALNTLAGLINSAHDLMGMIIIEKDNIESIADIQNLDPNNIYYDLTSKKYYYKAKKYHFTSNAQTAAIAGSDLIDVHNGNYYRLKSIACDNLGLSETEYSNYYKVQPDEQIREDEVYGTISLASEDPNNKTSLSSDLFNLDPKLEDGSDDKANWLYTSKTAANGSESYTRKVNGTPKNEKYYKITELREITAEQKEEEKTFYIPNKYYVWVKEFNNISEKNEWLSETEIDGDEVVRFGLLKRSILKNAIENAVSLNIDELDEDSLIAYRFLENVKYKKSSGGISDRNMKINTIPLDQLSQVEESYYYTLSVNGSDIVSEIFIPEKVSIEEVDYVKGYVKVYKNIKDTSLSSRSLYEWNSWIIENPSVEIELELDENIQSGGDQISYDFRKARFVDFQEAEIDQNTNSYTTTKYYWKSKDEPISYTRLTYNEIIEYSNTGNGQAAANWYELEISDPVMYYSVEQGYYLKDADDNYIRETTSQLRKDNEAVSHNKYLSIQWHPLENKKVFIPNTYYYKDGNEYILAETLDSTKTYYRYIDTYVVDDDNEVYSQGTYWNKEMTKVPKVEQNGKLVDAVTLGYKTFEWELREIPDFAFGMNTLHGLILKANKLLLDNDNETRDTSTVQGAINRMNDIIDKFYQLNPGEIVTVDEYGRIHSVDWDSEQKFGYNNIGKPTDSLSIPSGDPVASDKDRWIRLTLNDDKDNPHIKLEHMYNPVASTITTADKNLDGETGNGLNAGHGDTINLYTPIVDNTGHIIGQNMETVTLPFGFKTIGIKNTTASLNNNVWSAELDNNDTEIVADNTQDKLNIETNEWLNIAATDANNIDKLVFTHEYPYQESNTFSYSNKNNIQESVANEQPTTDKISLETVVLDNAGHVKHVNTETVTLPYGFKTIKVSNDSQTVADAASTVVEAGQSADNTQDTLTFSASNKWIKLDNNTEDTIKVGHLVGNIEKTVKSDTDINNNGDYITLQDIEHDEAGHITSNQSHRYKLPNGFAHIETDQLVEDLSNPGSYIPQVLDAENTQDTLVINGDSWINTSFSANGVSITHKNPESETRSENNVTPAFGETFTIEDWAFDNKGHKTGMGTHTVTIPNITLETALDENEQPVEGDVITDVVYENGVFTKSKDFIGNLELTYTPEPTLNPDYDPEDPTSEEYIIGETETYTLTNLLNYVKQLENRINQLEEKIIELEPPTYGVTYRFNGTYPQEVFETLPVDNTEYAVGDIVTPLAPTSESVAITEGDDIGVWTFDGWDENSKEIVDSNIEFVGTWTFKPEENVKP